MCVWVLNHVGRPIRRPAATSKASHRPYTWDVSRPKFDVPSVLWDVLDIQWCPIGSPKCPIGHPTCPMARPLDVQRENPNCRSMRRLRLCEIAGDRYSWEAIAKIVFAGQSYAGTRTCTTCYGATGEEASSHSRDLRVKPFLVHVVSSNECVRCFKRLFVKRAFCVSLYLLVKYIENSWYFHSRGKFLKALWSRVELRLAV